MFKKFNINLSISLLTILATSFMIAPLSAEANNAPPGYFALKTPATQCIDNTTIVVLSWGSSKNTTSYSIERQKEGTSTWNKVSSTLTSSTLSFTDNLGSITGVFLYRARATNGNKATLSNLVTTNAPGCATPPPPSSVVWGAYTGNTLDSLNDFQQQVGKQPNINAVFVGWGDDFPTSIANTLRSNNQTILIYWEALGYSYSDILSGASDAYIASFGTQARNFGGPVILVPFAEMNGNWASWGGTVSPNTPTQFVPMWQHVHNVFGASSNVKWGWAVNSNSVPDTLENQIGVYYPGSNYVDYVGVDGFNFGDPWLSFSDIFSSALATLKTFNKPIYIFSMACAEDQRKAEWISDALSQIYSNADVSGWIWFNANKEKNWLVWSNPDALEAFKLGIK